MLSYKDKYFLLEAIHQAEKGNYKTHPNPKVGCVIVKNNKIISYGYHEFFGGPHAEVNAINSANTSVYGSTLYVTLEPCSTYGKTPPCTDLIIRKGIKRVVCGVLDPNPSHRGKGIEILKKSGIKCEIADGELRKRCIDVNEVFFKNMNKSIPYVTIKLATSIDGKIADLYYNSKWISSKLSRTRVQLLRAYSDCIIIGSKTLIKDNPKLTVRELDVRKQPDVCVIGNLELSKKLNIFKERRRFFILSKNYINLKPFKNFEIIHINPHCFKNRNTYDMNFLIKTLYNYGIKNVLVEGGAYTVTQFINQKVFDKIILFISPIIIGKGINWFNDIVLFKNSSLGLKLKTLNIERIEDDVLMELKNV
ncbi:MAG: bifunctional diaminohydroxyphosphoribosylaminopyrimidine deaminase/5-amino-6-(5-phosphoribosylamino)uracil reductase RibD [Elusimicrobiales bacterium]|nr:bifunctional diaminohydroxyphosphoribosylaminopyrimidine deaminase/5-amino-6-(5-phosphoribosylamino)uracil reductase RibD [Elusimicrobiales bacterium]